MSERGLVDYEREYRIRKQLLETTDPVSAQDVSWLLDLVKGYSEYLTSLEGVRGVLCKKVERAEAALAAEKEKTAAERASHEKTRARAEQLRDVVRRVEWSGRGLHPYEDAVACPMCYGHKRDGGHDSDCRLRAALADTTPGPALGDVLKRTDAEFERLRSGEDQPRVVVEKRDGDPNHLRVSIENKEKD